MHTHAPVRSLNLVTPYSAEPPSRDWIFSAVFRFSLKICKRRAASAAPQWKNKKNYVIPKNTQILLLNVLINLQSSACFSTIQSILHWLYLTDTSRQHCRFRCGYLVCLLTFLAAVDFTVFCHEFFELTQQLHRLLPDKTHRTNTDHIPASSSTW